MNRKIPTWWPIMPGADESAQRPVVAGLSAVSCHTSSRPLPEHAPGAGPTGAMKCDTTSACARVAKRGPSFAFYRSARVTWARAPRAPAWPRIGYCSPDGSYAVFNINYFLSPACVDGFQDMKGGWPPNAARTMHILCIHIESRPANLRATVLPACGAAKGRICGVAVVAAFETVVVEGEDARVGCRRDGRRPHTPKHIVARSPRAGGSDGVSALRKFRKFENFVQGAPIRVRKHCLLGARADMVLNAMNSK